jgi:hypothetical protein
MAAEEIVAKLAECNPIGSDAYEREMCHFCFRRFEDLADVEAPDHFLLHADDCLWVAARRFTDAR